MGSDWQTFKVFDFADVIGGGTPNTKIAEYWNGFIPWLTPKDLSNYTGRYISKGERNISKKGLSNSSARILPPKTVLLTSRAPVGYLAIAKNELTTNQGFRSLIVKGGFCPEFIYYLLLNNVEYLKRHASGSTFQELSGSTLKELEFQIPVKISEQRAIAHILGSLDDKIELNHQMNQTLEEIGQTIFRHWFVHFEFPNEDGQPYKSSGGEMVDSELGEIPAGWKIGKLEDIANLMMGLSPKSDSYNQDRIGVPLLNGAADLKEDKIAPTKYTISPTRICKLGDILFCIRATIGNINFADNEYCLGRGVASISGKESYHTEFIYFQISKSLENLISQAAGSVIKGLSKPDIQNIEIIIPPAPLLRKFSSITSKHFEEIQNLKKENQYLSRIRDSLLPKLMSGKIRVPVEATAK